jgi:CDP-paratose 2-epimerase
MIEAIERFGELYDRELEWTHVEEPRRGDHICYISDLSRVRRDHPGWELTVPLDEIFSQLGPRAAVPAAG